MAQRRVFCCPVSILVALLSPSPDEIFRTYDLDLTAFADVLRHVDSNKICQTISRWVVHIFCTV